MPFPRIYHATIVHLTTKQHLEEKLIITTVWRGTIVRTCFKEMERRGKLEAREFSEMRIIFLLAIIYCNGSIKECASVSKQNLFFSCFVPDSRLRD